MTLKTITASIALVGIAATAAQAEGVAPAAEPSLAAPSPTTASARRVVRDTDTGKLRAPSDEELAVILESERAARQVRGQPEPSVDRAPLVVRRHANGMQSALLGPEYLVTIKARRGADGKVEVTHSDPAHEHPAAQVQRATE